jgi:hypothetical protein
MAPAPSGGAVGSTDAMDTVLQRASPASGPRAANAHFCHERRNRRRPTPAAQFDVPCWRHPLPALPRRTAAPLLLRRGLRHTQRHRPDEARPRLPRGFRARRSPARAKAAIMPARTRTTACSIRVRASHRAGNSHQHTRHFRFREPCWGAIYILDPSHGPARSFWTQSTFWTRPQGPAQRASPPSSIRPGSE